MEIYYSSYVSRVITDTKWKEWMNGSKSTFMFFVWYGWKQEHSNKLSVFVVAAHCQNLLDVQKTMNKSFSLKKFIKKTSSNDMMLRSLAEMTAI